LKNKKNILVVTYWGCNSGILNSYALPYVRIIKKNLPEGSKIFLFTLTPAGHGSEEDCLRVKNKLAAEGITLVNHIYKPFGLGMVFRFISIFAGLIFLTLKQRISYIHAWCTPGGAIGYFISLFTGKTLVLDSFEPHAQSMLETKTWKPDSFAFKLLFKLEKLQLKRAKFVICPTEGMIPYSQKVYHTVKSNYFVKPACVDLTLFSPQNKNFSLVEGIDNDSIVCVYAGKFGDIYLTGEVFDFFKVATEFWKEKFKVLLLTNHSDEEINCFCKNASLERSTIIKRFVHHTEVASYLSIANFAICPVRPVPTKQFCTPIKNGEYWAMGLPVVITKNISDDSGIIEENNVGYVLQDLNRTEYLNAVKKIDELMKDRQIAEKIRQIAQIHRTYSIAEDVYKKIYAV
jgi:glycosyltransferase involved in cell wall biosynthesis